MQRTIKAAVVQMNARLDKQENWRTAQRLVRDAARQQAELVVLPELFNAYGPLADVVAQAESIPGPTTDFCARLAKELGITLCAGSLCERDPDSSLGYNTSLLFGPSGNLLSKYRKMHLFDVEIPGQVSSRESDYMRSGNWARTIETDLGALGQAICYDLRFPELFRNLSQQNLDILLLPSAFTATTGKAHWEVLVRARAIENQCFVLAANQYGEHSPKQTSFGTSLIVDPWGEVLARGSLDAEAVLVAELSTQVLERTRLQVPALRHRSSRLA